MTEHFVTLFDRTFLVFGLALHRSLLEQAGDFCLWVVCMDAETEQRLHSLCLPRLRVIPLRDAETAAMVAVRAGRTKGEYCWTMTPFSITAVLGQDPSVSRVTYVDADVYFFGDPRRLVQEMIEAGKHVMITDHSYDPRYEQTTTSGRFCVQFMPFNRSLEALQVCRWWQARCIEWCFNRAEDGKFGDQKYLDDWPDRFGNAVHILGAVEETLAPWNSLLLHKAGRTPVLFHFHGMRFMSLDRVRAFDGYQVADRSMLLYDEYCRVLAGIIKELGLRIGDLPGEVPPASLRQRLGVHWRRLVGRRFERAVSV